MRRIYLIIGLLFSVCALLAQLKPVQLQEGLEAGLTTMKPFCSPGVQNKSRSRGIEISYNLFNGGQVDGLDGTPASYLRSLETITFKIKAPVILKPDFKI
ncbi:MAG: hypothetical protein R3350_03535, partial [Saprospiraceae bacterium]|nr:hypothetical protein [Saprospiraceae bacterium]